MSWTIYGSPAYAKIKEIPELHTLTPKEIYDYISKNSQWLDSDQTEFEGVSINNGTGWLQFLNDNEELVAFDIWYKEDEECIIAQLVELNETEIRREKEFLLFEKIKEEYQEHSEVCMSEFLSQRKLKNCDAESAFDLYVKLMKWADNDRFYRVNHDEKWIEECTSGKSHVTVSDEFLSMLESEIKMKS